MAAPQGQQAIADKALGADCVAHAKMFFNRVEFDLASAVAPTFALRPRDGMIDALRRDYAAMVGMIFGPAPAFGEVLDSIGRLEDALNA